MLYTSGDRVKLQNAKSKEWGLTGTILEPRVTDDGRIVSYSIRTDSGYDALHHRRFLRPLITKQVEQPEDTAIPDKLESEERAQPGQTELTQAGPPRVRPKLTTRRPVKLYL